MGRRAPSPWAASGVARGVGVERAARVARTSCSPAPPRARLSAEDPGTEPATSQRAGDPAEEAIDARCAMLVRHAQGGDERAIERLWALNEADLHVHGVEGVKFYTRTKVVTTRWPNQDTPAPGLNMPTLG